MGAQNRLVLEGWKELVAELGKLPATLRAEGMEIIKEEATGAAIEIATAYQEKTGTLRKRVEVDVPSSTILAAVVLSTAPHAHLYEFGTQVRRTATGANRGAAPPHPVTVPIARRRRDRMKRRLADLLRRQGFEVSDALG